MRQVAAAEAPAASLKSLLDSLDASRDALKADLDIVYEYAADTGVSLDSVSADAKGISISGFAAYGRRGPQVLRQVVV